MKAERVREKGGALTELVMEKIWVANLLFEDSS